MMLEKLTTLKSELDQGFDPEQLSSDQVKLLNGGLSELLDTDIEVIKAADLSKSELTDTFNKAVFYSNKLSEAHKILDERKEYFDEEVLPECVHNLNESLTSSDVLNRMAQAINTRAILKGPR